MRHNRAVRCVAAAAAVLALTAAPASATSGFGCYRVNVGPSDPLAIRARPDDGAPAVGRAHWDDQPIIALDGVPRGEAVQPSLFDVHRTELRRCTPSSLPLGARWCPVSFFDGHGRVSGWLKRRFVDHGECP